MLYPVESGFSSEASTTIGISSPFASPITANVDSGTLTIALQWDVVQTDVYAYRVYYKTSYEDVNYTGTGLTWNNNPAPSFITVLVSELADPLNPSLSLGNVIPEQPYWFKMEAVDIDGIVSATTAQLEFDKNVTLPPAGGTGGGAALPLPRGLTSAVNQTTKAITLVWD